MLVTQMITYLLTLQEIIPFKIKFIKLKQYWPLLDFDYRPLSNYPFSFIFVFPCNLLRHYLFPSVVHLLILHINFATASFTFDENLQPIDTTDTLKNPFLNLHPYEKAVLKFTMLKLDLSFALYSKAKLILFKLLNQVHHSRL